MKEKEKYIESYCIGQWERFSTVCNGNPKAKKDELRKPCSWCNKCRAFTLFLEANDRNADTYVEIVSDGHDEYARPVEGLVKFNYFLNGLLAKSINGKKKRTNGSQREVDKRRLGPTPHAKRMAAKARRERSKKLRAVVRKLIEEFKNELSRRLGGRRIARPREVVFPGEIYVVDRLEEQRYLSFYCQVVKGRQISIVSFRTKVQSLSCTVHFTLEPEELNEILPKGVLRKLKFEKSHINGFKAQARRLDREKIILVAEVVAKLIKAGRIQLPDL